MKEKAKRLLVLVLTFSMIFSMFPTTSFAATTSSAEVVESTDEEMETLEEGTTDANSSKKSIGATEASSEETTEEEVEDTTDEGTKNGTNKETGNVSKDETDVITGEGTQGVVSEEADSVDTAEIEEKIAAIEDDVANPVLLAQAEEDTDIDTLIEDDVQLETVKEEGEDAGLTEDEVTAVVEAYAQYLDYINSNPQYLGRQTAYLISKNDTEDDLGILGSMLIIAGYTVDDVREGKFGYSDIMGTIQTFYYGNYYGIECYGDEVLAAKDDALAAVAASGAQTDAQKLLALNEWLSQNAEFDMAYIMNQTSDGLMAAEDPQTNENYDEIYAMFKTLYYNQYYNEYYDVFYQQAYYVGVDLDLDGDGTEETNTAGSEELSKTYAESAADSVGTQAAEGAAPAMTEAVIGYWTGSHFGVLSSSLGNKGVCLSYTNAYAYLVQWLYPEIYGTSETMTSEDLEEAENWKSTDNLISYDEDGSVDVDNSSYMVDYVRITYNAKVTMYGESNPDFSSDHYWIAVKILNDNGEYQWYYIDPCYIDIFVECMVRERVETNGNMNHVYFLISDDSVRDMYDGYYSTIDTLYKDKANDTSYEALSWMYYAASNVYSDDENYYYLYDSTDMIGMLEEYGSMTSYYDESDIEDSEYKLVSYAKYDESGEPNKDTMDSEENKYTQVYVDFNNGQVYNPETEEMEDNVLIQELYAQQEEYNDIYPSVELSAAYYDGMLYFNLSNCILSYDLETGEVVRVKEYNEVGAVRDKTVEFGGMALTVTNDLENAELTAVNPPVAGLAIKDDGNLYVDLATNYCFISGKYAEEGKSAVEDTSSYGYEFQESNYNADYPSYLVMKLNNMDESESYYSMLESYIADDINDNDEFMWSANFTDIIETSELTSTEHEYETVSVDAFCGRDAFTEERCADCGLINPDVERITEEGTACDHHYVKYDETYYTTDDEGNFNTGTCYVCTLCGHSVNSDYTSDSDDYVEGTDSYEDAAAKAGHTYVPTSDATVTWADDHSSVTISGDLVCSVCGSMSNSFGYSRDCLQAEENPEVNETITLSNQTLTSSDVTVSTKQTCTETTTTYTATATVEGYGDVTATDVVTEEITGGTHTYEVADGDWVWTWDDETETYTAVAKKMTCSTCGDIKQNVEAVVTSEIVTSPTCTEEGSMLYTAVATVYDSDGTTVIGTATGTKTEAIAALGHTWENDIDWGEWSYDADSDSYTITASRTCSVCGEVENADVVVSVDTTDASCTEGGTAVYSATATFGEETTTYEATSHEAEIGALGHDYGESVWDWTENEDGSYSVTTATFTCTREGCSEAEEGHVVTVDATLEDPIEVAPACTKEGSITYTATATLDGQTYHSTKVTTIDALGHTWEDVVWGSWTKKSDGSYTITATRTCSVCGETEEADIAITAESKDATCTTAGTATFYATATFSDNTTAEATPKAVESAVLGHSYNSNGTCTRCGKTSAINNVDATFNDSTGTYTVTSTGSNKTASYTKAKSTATSVAIPSTVTVDGMTFKVTSVNDEAFKGNTKIKTVTVPSTVTTIGTSAFEGCTSLVAVNGCASVTKIGNKAFYNCKKLTQVGSTKGKVKLTKVKTIGSYAFYGCKSITVVKITSKNLTKINNYAFQNCTKLKKFVAKSTKLSKIGKKAFYGDKKLANVTLKTTKLKASKVGAKAFSGIKKNCNFKVPSKKVSAYKKLFVKKGAKSTIKVKK